MSTPLNVLIVEDVEDDAKLLLRELKRGGYAVTSERVETAPAMQAALERATWDLVVSDHRLPHFDSLGALKVLQASGQDLPFILVSGTIGEEAAVGLMKAGAHDFVMKGNLARLVPAIQRELRDAEGRRAQKKAEATVRESEERYRDLVENIQDLICTHDLQGQILSANQSATRLLGYSLDDLLKMNLRNVLAPEVRGDLDAYLATIHRDGIARGLLLVQTSHGEKRVWEYHNTLRTEGVSVPIVRGMARDVTERKRAEASVRVHEEYFRALIENGSDAISLLGEQGQVMYLSPSTERVMGWTQADRAGKDGLELVHPEDVPYLRARIAELRKMPGSSMNIEYRLKHKDGTWRNIEATSTSLLHNPSVRGIVTNYRDITERKRAEEEIQWRADELNALYDLSRALAGTDDFNNILNLAAHHLVESSQVTFARVLLVEGDEFVVRAAFPIRALPHELQIGQHKSAAALPFCQHALEQSDPIIVRTTDSNITDLEREFLFIGMAQSLLLVPLRVGETQRGLWILGEAREEKREPFTARKLRLIGSISEQVTGALQRTKLSEQTRRQLSQLQALHTIDIAISASTDLNVTLNLMLSQVAAQLNVDAVSILLLNPVMQTLEYAAGRGFRTKAIERTHLRLGESHAGRAASERHLVHATNLKDAPELILTRNLADEGFVGYYAVPFIAKGQVKGVLEIFNRDRLNPDEDWLSLLEMLAGQAAVAIDSAQLYYNLHRSNANLSLAYDATIEGWSHALDLRDKETEGHTQRVTEIALRLAKAMGIGDVELVHVRHGALLHDIGKMGVPDEILHKPGPLTDAEWVLMRKHPQLAYELISPIAYLKLALDIPYCHHEKWDGTGYPRGLAGDQIPLTARIFAIVDVWDALTTDRPYRKAWTNENARVHILASSGTHFDPRVVAGFFELLDADGANEIQLPALPPLLVVDDEENITRSIARSLRDSFQVFTANSGTEALAILEREEIAVILTDQRMPGLTGLELLKRAQEIRPYTMGLLISAYSESVALYATLNLTNVRGYIPKPWDADKLLQQLNKVAREYYALRRNR